MPILGPETGYELDNTQHTPPEGRIFLVVIDGTEELKPALDYACLRAKRSNGHVALLYVIPPVEFEHFMFVGDVMREDRRKEAEALLHAHADHVFKLSGRMPIIHLREGDRREELLKFLEKETVHVLVLGANPGKGGPGPLISSLMGKDLRRVHVPMAIIPGSLSEEEIYTLTTF
ncbi:MAG: universal stress protein [Rhodospirillaceae bacterium]|nr:universal stress protein [Rhodospirillaceae bacterium]